MKIGAFPEPAAVEEEVVLAIDFKRDDRLAEGETLSSPVVTPTVRVGVDPDVGTLLSAPTVVGTQVICRKARNKGVNKAVYLLKFQVDTSNNQRLQLGALLACENVA